MTEEERIRALKERFDFVVREDLRCYSWRGGEASYPVNAEEVEGDMERPGVDTKPFSYQVKDGRARGEYF